MAVDISRITLAAVVLSSAAAAAVVSSGTGHASARASINGSIAGCYTSKKIDRELP